MIDLIEDEDINVAETSASHALSLESSPPGSFMSYDPLATASLRGYFDGFVTAPVGVFNHQPFATVARTVSTLAEFVGWLIRHHDEDTKLLYMVQRFDTPQLVDLDAEPLHFNVRYAIITN